MAKRLSEKQKKEIKQNFLQGDSVEILSKSFGCTKLTIIRNLKKVLGDSKYNELSNKKFTSVKSSNLKNKKSKTFNFDSNNQFKSKDSKDIKNLDITSSEENSFLATSFLEIAPLDYEIDYTSQKDLSSIPISEVEFPSVVYMIVDKKIELEVKYLKDYPSWQFLSDNELNRKTIEIYFDLKIAKSLCNKEQKLIKVPNSDVFKIAAPFLISRGITRIVSPEKLIAL